MLQGFAVEDKYDGIRAQAHIAPASSDHHLLLHGDIFAGIRVALFSRTLDEITPAFPDLVRPLASMTLSAFGMGTSAGVILDGEIVPFRDDRILPFQELQKRLGRKTLSDELLRSVPVAFIAYDILYQDGRVLIEVDVVITAAEVGTGKRSRFLSDYTFAMRASEDDPTLLNVGKAYSGLTDAEVQELSDWLKQHTLQEFAHGRVRTVEPKIVLEVTFDRVAEPVLAGVSTCFIAHHHPEGVPPGDTLITAYTWNPIPNTSWLVWQLCQQIAEVSDLDWMAAIGTLSDLGDRAPFDLLTTAKRKYTGKYLKEATALINAARRAAHYQPDLAATALLNHADPKSLVNSSRPEVEQLRQDREAVKRELEVARKVAPIFAGKVALLRLNSPCQIHPLCSKLARSPAQLCGDCCQ